MRALAFGVFCVALTACESRFAGDRAYDLQTLNGTYTMKVLNVGSMDYLTVLNTNLGFATSTGSLQFYSLTTPSAPVRQAEMSLEVPSNTSDYVLSGTVLYVADRNKHRVLIYDFSGGKFQPRLGASSNQVAIKVGEQPQKLQIFTRASDSVEILAVVAQGAGMINFIRLDTLEYVTKGADTSVAPDVLTLGGIPGVDFYANPRRTIKADDDDPISISRPAGYGIGPVVYLGGTEQLFVVASTLSMALFGFRFENFQNSSNIVWDLPNARNGYDSNGVDYPGSKENGFRGLAADGAGNVYATSRADNGLYMVGKSLFQKAKEKVGDESSARRNTQGIAENEAGGFRLAVFDTVSNTDESFPRLLALAVNYCAGLSGGSLPAGCAGDGDAASVAWITGLGTKDGDQWTTYPKVYRIDLASKVITPSADGALGESPQVIYWHYPARLLYVANAKSNSISILRDDDLSLVATLQN